MNWIRAHFAEVASRTPEEKFNYAFRVSTAVTLGIFAIWASNFFVTLGNVSTMSSASINSLRDSVRLDTNIQQLQNIFQNSVPEVNTSTIVDTPNEFTAEKELIIPEIIVPNTPVKIVPEILPVTEEIHTEDGLIDAL